MKIINYILTAISGFIVLVCVILTIFYFKGITPTVVLTGSMSPKIPTGSVCFIDTKYPYSKLKVNDIIVYKFQKNQVIHRVIRVTDEGLETKGDANNFSDRISTTEKNYYGKYLFSIAGLGYYTVKMQNDGAKAIFIVVLISIFVLQYITREIVKRKVTNKVK